MYIYICVCVWVHAYVYVCVYSWWAFMLYNSPLCWLVYWKIWKDPLRRHSRVLCREEPSAWSFSGSPWRRRGDSRSSQLNKVVPPNDSEVGL